MAYASVTYTSASGTTFALTNSSGDPIEYIRQSDIAVYVNNTLQTLTTDYTFNSAGTAIVLNVAVSGATVLIQRTTDISTPTVVYTAGSTLTAQDLNNADNQLRYGLQEFRDFVNVGGGIPDGDKGDITVISNGTVWTIDNNVVTSAKIANGVTVNHDLGSASNPSVTFTGDLNTGIYSPGADQVAISTGGSGRLFVDASGRVGVGATTSPLQLLHVSTGNNTDSGEVSIALGGSTASARSALITKDTSTPFNFKIATSQSASVASALVFETKTSTEAARIDSSGRLLVGTSSNSQVSTIVAQGNSSGTTGAVLCLNYGATNPGTTSNLGLIRFSDSGSVTSAEIAAKRDSGTWTSGSSQPSALTFSTTADGASSPTERMRIDNAGNWMYGITSFTNASKGFLISGNSGRAYITCSGDTVLDINRLSSTGEAVAFRSSSTQVGSITVTGSATAYNTSSDYRLKENVVPLTGAADRVNQLQVHRFNFIADPDNTVDGFLAHEAQAVVPECVTGEKDAVDEDGNPIYQGIDQSKLVPLLTAALQEAIGRIETLEAEVAALKGA